LVTFMLASALITLSEFELQRFFFALVLLLGLAHTCGYLFLCWKMPRVIGEITGGFLLGPTVLGHFWPDAYHWLFLDLAAQPKLLSAVSWFGLVLLMFVSGFEIQKSLTRNDGRLILALLLGGTLLPFLAGWLAPHLFDSAGFLGEKKHLGALCLIMGIALAVTSIPVISKMFLDLNILHTRFAKVVVATATIEDVLLWIMLAVATELTSASEISAWHLGSTVLMTLSFFALTLLAAPWLMRRPRACRINVLLKASPSGFVLLLGFFFAALASLLAVNTVFGALVGGIIVGLMSKEKFENVRIHVKEVALGFFVPIYFAVVGLKLDLLRYFDPLPFLAFFAFATVCKVVGTMVAAKLAKQDWLSSLNLAVAMNTRGGPGIVLATVAFELGIISETFFVILVLTALFTSMAAGYWFVLVLSKGWQLLRPTVSPPPPEESLSESREMAAALTS